MQMIEDHINAKLIEWDKQQDTHREYERIRCDDKVETAIEDMKEYDDWGLLVQHRDVHEMIQQQKRMVVAMDDLKDEVRRLKTKYGEGDGERVQDDEGQRMYALPESCGTLCSLTDKVAQDVT